MHWIMCAPMKTSNNKQCPTHHHQRNAHGCRDPALPVVASRRIPNSTNQPHGVNCEQCLSVPIPYALNADAPGRLLTILSASMMIRTNRWNGRTFKQCVIVVTMRNRAVRRIIGNDGIQVHETRCIGLGLSKRHADAPR
jgi:hypothetical protein